MQSLNTPLIKINNLWQVCMVVHDLDKTMRTLWDTFGMGPWAVYRRDPDSSKDNEFIADMTYYGKPARFSYIMAGTQGSSSTGESNGPMKIELLQPLEGDSIHRDFLRDHGEGIQHVGWHVVESQEEFIDTKDKLEKAGFPCIMSARLYNSSWAFFDTTSILHTTLEVVWRDTTKSRPAPDIIFPG